MKLEPSGSGIGVIVTEADATNLSAAEWNTLYQAWLEHGVLVLRNQELNVEDFLALGRKFGRVKPHRVKRTRDANFPELTVMGINTKKADGNVDKSIFSRGGEWHTDGPWDPDHCKATQLYSLEVPSTGGDTLFANMYAAYEDLPQQLKEKIKDLKAEFIYGGRAQKSSDLLDPEDRNLPPVIHPLVRVHPETGRSSLFVNAIHILRIVGMPRNESDALIDELLTHMVHPNAQYRHQWKAKDVVVWDNRCTIHKAAGGYSMHERRVHWRCMVVEPSTQLPA